MLLLITYDVKTSEPGGSGRLRRLGRACADYGQRVQFSVFECEVNPDQWIILKERLLRAMKPEVDSLRVYHLGANWKGKVEHFGAKPSVDYQSVLLG